MLLINRALKEEREYWLKQLNEFSSRAILPRDYEQTQGQATWDTVERPFTPDLQHKLMALTNGSPFLLYATLLAALKICLYKYTHTALVITGSPPFKGDSPGPIPANALAIVDQVQTHLTFRQLLLNVRQTLLDAYTRQSYPIKRLIQDMGVIQDGNQGDQHPFFDVVLTGEDIHAALPEQAHDLTIDYHWQDSQLTLSLTYNTAHFTDQTVTRLCRHLLTCLHEALHDTSVTIGQLNILPTVEQDKLLVQWNNTHKALPPQKLVHQLVEARVSQVPDGVAVSWNNTSLTYRSLNERANQLARYLQKQGVGPGALVGIGLERSLDMVISLLAVLKAGGGYVPLDPAYPPDRLQYMLADAQVKMLLTHQALSERFPTPSQKHTVYLEKVWPTILQESPHNLAPLATADSPVYVMYTSGTTGKPKGVVMCHRTFTNLLNWQRQSTVLSGAVRTLQFTSLSFDVSFQEIFYTWASGGSLVLLPETTRRDTRQLLYFLKDQAVERLFLPFIALQRLAEVASQEGLVPPSLREVITAGEQLHITPAIARFFGGCQVLHNQYGPTESHVVTSWTLEGDPEQWPVYPPIGQPIDNTQIYLLNPQMQPVPIGVSGELYIGGLGLAQGYWQRPAQTAEKFVPHPFTSQKGARLYRTGDLARYQPNGCIEFLGRRDNQVKIRGYRVEPGEVEMWLSQHTAVKESAVVSHRWEHGGQQLVAYVVADNTALPTGELRHFLSQHLPDHMIPSLFIQLEAMPLTPSGKINRQALPTPQKTRAAIATPYIPPRTADETTLVQIWSELLHITPVGIEDNFFHLGGHSLLATELVFRIRQALQVEVSLQDLFTLPTIAALAEHIRYQQSGKEKRPLPSPQPAPRDRPLPLSFAQQRLWFLEQLAPNTPLYNLPVAVQLQGEFNLPALEHALSALNQRHESLRTTFTRGIEGQPQQRIKPPQPVSLLMVDLSQLPPSCRHTSASKLAAAAARRPFNLATGPLWRTLVLRLSSTEHIVLLNMHHIISDGWSMGILTREITQLYRAFAAGQPASLPDLPIQYPDFAYWQRQWLQGDVLAGQLKYWQEQLSGAIPTLDLPLDRPRPTIQTFNGATHTAVYPSTLKDQLHRLSQQENTTLFMTLLAAFQVLLYRYAHQADISVGTPVANRHLPGTEGLIGFFVNTLVMRTRLSDKLTFRQLLGQVRRTALAAYANQDIPFEALVETLGAQRSLSHSPLFQVSFALQNAAVSPLDLAEVASAPFPVDCGSAKFDLTLMMTETQQQLFASFEYNTDLFEAATIERMQQHFETLLQAISHDPDQTLADLPLLPRQEQALLLNTWNLTHTDYPCSQTLTALFEAQVQRAPDAIALSFGEQLSYDTLNRRANQLARYLQAAGVGPETYIAIYMPASADMLVAILAILKAGGAYLPVDTGYPPERITYMLRDAQVPLVLTYGHLVAGLPHVETAVFCLDQDWPQVSKCTPHNLAPAAEAENSALVIYTSGSTGRPKGILIPHRAINRLVINTNYMQPTAADRVGQVSNLSFDAATFEIWTALLHGGCLVGIPKETLLVASELATQLRQQRITSLLLTTALLNEVARQEPTALHTVRTLLFGGEAVTPRWVRKILDHAPPRHLIHAYGPAENTTLASWHEVHSVAEDALTVPIGRPVANTQLYLLDSQLHPVPIGVSGELYIGGDGLAHGYLNQPGLTAASFVPNPFSGQAGSRLYKSGDVARYRPDGTLEFLGRTDHQLKIRGFRIEPGEIEISLTHHPGIEAAAVLAHEDAAGQRKLVAYLVSVPDRPPTSTELQAYLRQSLPEFMRPTALLFLDALPLTPNGKVDRAALPRPEKAELIGTATYTPPRDMLELQLVRIWEDILSVKPVGIHHNFFEIGGHSLLAVQLTSRIENELNIRLPLATLFQGPTVATLAAIIRSRSEITALAAPFVCLQKGKDGERPLFLAHPVGGNLVSYTGLVAHLPAPQPVYGFQATPASPAYAELPAMARTYVQSLQSVQPEGPYYLCGWSTGGVLALEIARQLQSQAQEVAALFLLDALPPSPNRHEYDHAGYLLRFVQAFGLSPARIGLSYDELAQHSDSQQLAYILEHIRATNLLPAEMTQEQIQSIFDVFKRIDQALNHYNPATPFHGSVTLIRASEKSESYPNTTDLGWSAYVDGPVETVFMPGTHYSMMRPPLVAELATLLMKHKRS